VIPVGSLVEIVEDRHPSRHRVVGLKGVVQKYAPPGGNVGTLAYDVRLAEPLPDGRQCLWFSEGELVVL
jgi:hypothetical protein